ncbi:hypothetical protein GDO78_000728 [Eleutherodactylus coqui]|uniref:Uncharacterized protein n=1 Tax=Eleutherodactylus coqui TaxID=57060 RepID=A0A8J6FRY6_ELECQ|nr:hypothetical protein GDO78_000728 [Eleutherodactylus coqui]
MDPVSCMKSLLLTVAQYRGCKNDVTGAALQRQLELLTFKQEKLFMLLTMSPVCWLVWSIDTAPPWMIPFYYRAFNCCKN